MKMGRNLTNTPEPDESSGLASQTGAETRGEDQPPAETTMVEGLSISPDMIIADAVAGLSATPKKSPGMQTARIESLQRAIQRGNYRPLPEEIADALIYEMIAEGKHHASGLAPGNATSLDTTRTGSAGSAAGSVTVCSGPGWSATHRRTALQVASNGSFPEDPEPARATAEKDVPDGNLLDSERSGDRRSEDERVGDLQMTDGQTGGPQRVEHQRTNEQMNDERMNDEQTNDERMNRSA
jgi:anti-sigma28 factor (negative regulator of flagellin synthesis)